jgi:hypothetical protein
MGERIRKRSAAVTLVLAGSASLGGCGSPVEQRDAYATEAACVRDWSNAQLCEPVRDGHYSSSYFYGPPYYGSGTAYSLFGRTRSPRIEPSPNAMDAQRLTTGTVARSPTSALAMSSGVGPRGSGSSGGLFGGTSRGGFGSSSTSVASSGG